MASETKAFTDGRPFSCLTSNESIFTDLASAGDMSASLYRPPGASPSGQASAQAPLVPAEEMDATQKRVGLGINTKPAESILHDGVGW